MEKTTSLGPIQAPLPPPSYIKSTSHFGPRDRQCCQCGQTTSTTTTTTTNSEQNWRCECEHQLCRNCHGRDGRGDAVIPHSFPVDWICSTCGDVHSVLEILTRTINCACDSPTLQAVYDQFGRIFLFWRDDPAVFDLTDPAKVQEAAWRVWEAGSEPWLLEVVAAEKQKRAAGVKGHARGWNRMSQSSVSSQDSMDIAMAEMDYSD
ncbi:hypothetical protein B0H63DRAFT_95604 [Podospora didyma]|uniref:Uncharacterized protein n=1 Tax=Podospora didyma TaxID=330526 RepID=A0AAE0NX20_9PEZI|nr:hypothetical protein B0H63DRAFT_95604 [Podospora didyma]